MDDLIKRLCDLSAAKHDDLTVAFDAAAHIEAQSAMLRECVEALEMALQCADYCRENHKDAQSWTGIPVEFFYERALTRAKEMLK